MMVILSLFTQAELRLPVYRVAIIDRFFPPAEGFENDEERVLHGWLYGMMDLDDDERREPFYHGDVVRMIASHPQITFIQYPILDGKKPMSEILVNLQNLLARYEKQPVDAVLLSWESSTLISTFKAPLQLERAAEYKDKVREMGQADEVWKTTYQIIIALEALTAQGIQVYTIAGNGGRGMINTFSLADDVVTVGSVEPELKHFVANNPFVDTYARAAYEVIRVDDSEGEPVGYDLNGDQCVDIPLNRLTGYSRKITEYPKKFWRLLTGSSFAAPAALKAALFANLPLRTCH
ncbi:hypothetical protein [Endozoicomonas sp. 8E]|uniref:hypothetical protein n=1 Tax=Endozoicomonas sp. 8E TaxID=3035692 RepID=UPI002938F98B|nr:hypothetical protein [Endozoicomonas sp. 8E]WOG25531.1 hypothetical protein P6910_13155 [Endozoicomonas sp. 8E]